MNQMLQAFGVPIYIGTLKNHKKIKSQFEKYVADDAYFHTPVDWHSTVETSFGHARNGELPWQDFIQEVVSDHLGKFIAELNPKVETATRYEVWANRYSKGQYQESHNHATPNSHFSCNYVMSAPKNSGDLLFVDKTHDFWEQTGLRNMFDIPFSRKMSPGLKEGDLVIFPSFLEHYVSPNTNNDVRITFAANFFLQENK